MGRKRACQVSLVLTLGLVMGSSNAAPLQQGGGLDGLVSVEAEHFDNNVAQGGDQWVQVGPTGAFTGVGMQAQPNDDTGTRKTGYATRSPRLDYQILFSRTGIHYVWIRGYGATGNDDSVHAGLNGEEIATSTSDNMSGWQGIYAWSRNSMDGAPSTLDVPSSGQHTLNIWMREDGFIIDKIVLTSNPDYTPTGDGPPESERSSLRIKAYGASPAEAAQDVPRDTVLAWTPGVYAATHDVYLGATLADVEAASTTSPKGVLVSQGQDANTYDPAGLLAFGQTYSWRIDEVNAPPDSTISKGTVWSFTVEPVAYPVTTPITATASSSSSTSTGPEKTIDGSGLNANNQHSTDGTHMWLSNKSGPTPPWIHYEFDRLYKLHQMWVWNSNQLVEVDFGMGAKDVTIDTSMDGSTWTPLAGVPEFAQATGTADYVTNTTVDFGGALAKYVRLNIQSNWGGTKSSGLSEVRFFYIPVKAFGPTPASAATNAALDGELNWRPGREAARHEVYVSTDPNALSKVNIVTDHRYPLNTLGLEYDRTYYWKVNEVNEAANLTTWEGDLWRFSTPLYALVDDFEAYDDTCNRIYYFWADGAGTTGAPECGVAAVAGNGSSAAVGNTSAPYAEKTIVHSGKQSMPLEYGNATWPCYSEIQREWAVPQNWSGGGINTLTVSFWGYPIAFVEPAPGAVTMSGIGTDIFGTADQFRFAYKPLSGNGSIIAKVDSLVDTDPWAKAGVMIRETLEAGSAWASVFSTGTNGARYQARLSANSSATSDTAIATPEQLALHQPVWIKLERSGNDFNGYYSTDAKVWTAMVWNPQTIPMAANVYIGLAVTSHNASYPTTAQYTGISTTGSISGGWLTADIGATQTVPNAPDTVYVAIEDSSRRIKVVSHPNPGATATGIWEEWKIPLSPFTSAGINLGSVTKMVIGVGDRSTPKAGGKGKLYIDDILLTRAAPP
jgi:hypothetical protein